MECEKSKMPETSAKDLIGTNDSSEQILDRISNLCLSENYSDVAFLVEDQRLPGHKCILAAANKYFQSLLYDGLSESNQKEIKLEVPLEAFKALLIYIYSGQICLLNMEEENVLDLLVLANTYGFTVLERDIVKHLNEKVDINNILPIFKRAWHCKLSDLKEVCYTFMTGNASKILTHESFKDLSKELLEDVIRRDSFLAPEFEIFEAVIAWSRHNPDADIDSVLSYIRFPLMTVGELSRVRKLGIVKVDKLMDAVEVKNASRELPYRVLLREDMVALKYGSKLITGVWETNSPPADYLSENQEGTDSIAKQESCYKGIVVELGIKSVINWIEFNLIEAEYSYSLEVSTNQSQWKRIVDYRYFICRRLQILSFPPKYVKYIKLTGTGDTNLRISALTATYMDLIPKQINGFMAASIEIYGTTQEGSVVQKRGIFDNTSDDRTMEVDVQLNQPYVVGAILLFLSDTPFPPFKITCKISANGQIWESIECRNQDILFEPCEVGFIKLSSNNRCFRKSTDVFILAHIF